MTRRMSWLIVVAALAAVPARAPAADPVPTVVIRARSLESLAEDLKYLAALVGQDDVVREPITQITKLPGIDFKKPLGAYAFASPGIVDSGFAVLIPVTSEKEALELIGVFGLLRPQKDDDGIYTLSFGPVPFPIHFRFAHGYAYVTAQNKAALDKDKLLAPAKLFPASQSESIVATLRFDLIPQELRQVAASQLDLNLPILLEQKGPFETEAQHKVKLAVGKEMANLAMSLLRDGREIRLAFDLDRKAHTAAAHVRVEGASGSELAKDFANLGRLPSPFAGLGSADAAASLGVNLMLPEGLMKTVVSVLEDGLRKDLENAPSPELKSAVTRVFKAFEPTLKAGRVQFGVTLRGPSATGRFTAVGGIHVQNGAALEQALRDFVKIIPPDVRDPLKLDEVKVGAVSIHRIGPPKGLPENALKVLSDRPWYAAITGDAVYVAAGENGLDALKQALALKPAPAPVFQAEIAFARMAALVPPGADPVFDTARKAFQGADKRNDRLLFKVEGGDALKVRLESKTSLLKFFHDVGQAQRGGQ